MTGNELIARMQEFEKKHPGILDKPVQFNDPADGLGPGEIDDIEAQLDYPEDPEDDEMNPYLLTLMP